MNERIRAKELRLIDQNGDNQGVVPTLKALQMAYDERGQAVLGRKKGRSIPGVP